MKITILTLFPEMFEGPFSHSILKKAQEKKLITIEFVNIRDFGIGKHKIVDDTPYGGGTGMVLRVDVVAQAIASTRCTAICKEKVVITDPRGNQFTQAQAQNFSRLDHLIIVCGHYEGIDERVYDLVDESVSMGDFILTGGEIPAMAITDAVVRLIKGVIKDDATKYESFSDLSEIAKHPTLEYPHYTKPQVFNEKKVPDELLGGNHKTIKKWREEQSVFITIKRRPDLILRKK